MQRSFSVLPVVIGLQLAAFPVTAAVLLNDDFTAATRVGTAPTVTGVDRDGGTANNYVVATNGSAGMATGVTNDRASNVGTGINDNSFVVINESNAYSVTTHFASTTLAPGDSLALTFNMRTSTASPTAATGAFRTGLFNSGGTPLSANTNAFGGSGVFTNDTGYIANYTTTAGGLTGIIQDRSAGTTTNNIFAGTVTTLGSTGTGTNLIVFDTTYPVTLTLTLSLDGTTMNIASSVNGLSLSSSDTAAPYTTFDSVGIFFGSQFGNGTTPRSNFIDDVSVVHTQVPEPTGLFLSVGAALGLLLHRKRA